MELARIDLPPRHRPPRPAAVAAATVASLVLCLLADWLLVRLAPARLPAGHARTGQDAHSYSGRHH